RPFFVGKGELKAAFRTRAVDQPDITRGSKAKLGAVMSSNLPVVVSRGQDEVLRRRLDCLAVHHKARPLALIELGSARVKPMLQRRGWPALSSLTGEVLGQLQERAAGCLGARFSDTDLKPMLHEHAESDAGRKHGQEAHAEQKPPPHSQDPRSPSPNV